MWLKSRDILLILPGGQLHLLLSLELLYPHMQQDNTDSHTLADIQPCGIWEDRAEERKKVVVLRELHRAIIYTTR
jgi:hypothetical protein